MTIKIIKREPGKLNKSRKIWYTLEWGKGAGQRYSTGIFTYINPKTVSEKNHNKEALAILESKRSKMILDRQAIGSNYIPVHKIKSNFLDFYGDFVKKNARIGSRHLPASYAQFKEYLKTDFISASEITEDKCENFRSYLLKKYNGETPTNHFREFKRVIKAGKKNGYFVDNPVEDIHSKENPNRKRKEVLESEEWIKLLNTPCLNHEIKRAFVTSMFVGLKVVRYKNIEMGKY